MLAFLKMLLLAYINYTYQVSLWRFHTCMECISAFFLSRVILSCPTPSLADPFPLSSKACWCFSYCCNLCCAFPCHSDWNAPFRPSLFLEKKNYVHGVHVCLCTTRLQCSCRLEKGIRSSGTELPRGSSGREAHALNHKEFPLHPFPFLASSSFPEFKCVSTSFHILFFYYFFLGLSTLTSWLY